MKMYDSFAFTMHVMKAQRAIAGRCQVCKKGIVQDELIITQNGHEEIPWLFTLAHVECFRNLVGGAYAPLLSQDVFCTPKVQRNGPRVEVTVGVYAFNFAPQQAYNFAVSLVMSAVASSFDHFVYELMTDAGLEALPILQKIREARAQKTISDVSVVGTPVFLFEDCWNTFRQCIQEYYGGENCIEFLSQARKRFDEEFIPMEKAGDKIQ